MRIRLAGTADLAAILALRPADFTTSQSVDLLQARLAAADAWVAEEDGGCIGHAWRGRFFGHDLLEQLHVAQSRRRRGAASALMAAFEQARRGGRIFVSTNRSNGPMRCLLAKRGYGPSGVICNLDPGDPELVFVRRYDGEAVEACS